MLKTLNLNSLISTPINKLPFERVSENVVSIDYPVSEAALSLNIQSDQKNNRFTITFKGIEVENQISGISIRLIDTFFDSLGLAEDKIGSIKFESIGSESKPINLEISSDTTTREFSLDIKYCYFHLAGVRGTYNSIHCFHNKFYQFRVSGQIEEDLFISSNDIAKLESSNQKLDSSLIQIQCDVGALLEFNENKNIEQLKVLNNLTNECEIEGNDFKTVQLGDLRGNDHFTIGNLIIRNNELVELKILKTQGLNKSQLSKIIVTDNAIGRITLNTIDFEKDFGLILSGNTLENVDLKNTKWSYKSLLSGQYKSYDYSFENILLLKSSYQKINDSVNERIFRAFEKTYHFKSSRNFHLPLFLAYHTNRFGLDLKRSFLWLLVLIICESAIIIILPFLTSLIHYLTEQSLVSLLDFWNFGKKLSTIVSIWKSEECHTIFFNKLGYFTTLINPAHKTSLFVELIDNCSNSNFLENTIYLVDNLFRIAIGYTIFQLISAFRYKYDLK